MNNCNLNQKPNTRQVKFTTFYNYLLGGVNLLDLWAKKYLLVSCKTKHRRYMNNCNLNQKPNTRQVKSITFPSLLFQGRVK
jgi:hypothetical protein